AGDFADLLPGQEAFALGGLAAEIDRLVFGRIDPCADRRKNSRPLIGLKQGKHPCIKTAITVIESEQQRLVRQRFTAVPGFKYLVYGNGPVTVFPEPGELLNQVFRAD